jgi:hypothetical protein
VRGAFVARAFRESIDASAVQIQIRPIAGLINSESKLSNWRFLMKHLSWIAAAALAAFSVSVCAQDAAMPAASADADRTTMSQAQTPALPTPASGIGAAVQPAGKTRAQVYQELIRAQKDGTLERLNALYGN